MKRIIVIIVIALIVILSVFKLISNRNKITTQSENLFSNEVSVTVADVGQRDISPALNVVGTVYPVKELDIPAETSGKLKTLNYTIGQNVKAGNVIANIDDELKKLSYESAKIDAEKAEKDYNRLKNLLSGGTTSQQEFDNAKFTYETAKNKVADAAQQLSYTKITTPISGTISKKLVEVGTYVNAGTAVASVVDISKLKVKANLSESNAYSVSVGNKVQITSDIYPGVVFVGKVSFVSSRGDDAHNYPVEIELSNTGKNQLKGGTFVNITFEIGTNRMGLSIPREALQGSVKEAKVYVAENGKAHLKKIVIGREGSSYLEVLSGLSENEKVVVSGQVNLTDNKAIKIINNN
jgi:membrane fusion protein, multidrug efflux system